MLIIIFIGRNLISKEETKKKPKLRPFTARALITVKDNSLLYTPIPKCGWSTWVNAIFENFNINETERNKLKYVQFYYIVSS